MRFNCLGNILKCLSLIILSGCSQNHLTVQTQYLTHENLASYHVNTPDPKLAYPSIGQRLLITWSIPSRWIEQENSHLEIQLRYRNREVQTLEHSITTCHGTHIIKIMDDDYCRTEGILSYKIDLIVDGVVQEEWRHQLWADLIEFDNELN